MTLRTLAILVLVAGCWSLPCDATQAAATKHSSDESGRATQDAVALNRSTTLYTSAAEGEPIQKAAEDLAVDLQAVLGTRPKIIHRQEDSGPLTIFIGEQSRLPEDLRANGLTAPESFSISLREERWNPRRTTKVVVLSGADMRGTSYAVYQFSEKYLGIDPLHYWTDHQPARRTS